MGGERVYAVGVLRAERPQALVGAPWERQRLRRFAKQVALPGRSRLHTAALGDALIAWAASQPPEAAARGLPISRLKHPWARWWRSVLLHAAHPDTFPVPASGAFVELELVCARAGGWLPSRAPTTTERRLAANAIRAMLPGGSMAAEIARRQRPGWNQVVPQELMWELAVSHIRARSFKLRMMLPAAHTDGLAAGRQHNVALSLSLAT